MSKTDDRKKMASFDIVLADFLSPWSAKKEGKTSYTHRAELNRCLSSLFYLLNPDVPRPASFDAAKYMNVEDITAVVEQDSAYFAAAGKKCGISVPLGFKGRIEDLRRELREDLLSEKTTVLQIKENTGGYAKQLEKWTVSCPSPSLAIGRSDHQSFVMASRAFYLLYILCRCFPELPSSRKKESEKRFSFYAETVKKYLPAIPEYALLGETDDSEQAILWKIWMAIFVSRREGAPAVTGVTDKMLSVYKKSLSKHSELMCDAPLSSTPKKINVFSEHYIPVDLTRSVFIEEKSLYEEAEKGSTTHGIFSLIAKAEPVRIAVLARAGYGKTTMCKAIAAHYTANERDEWMYRTDNKKRPTEKCSRRRLPFVIPCSSLKVRKKNDFAAYMVQACVARKCFDGTVKKAEDFVTGLLSDSGHADNGGLLLLIDGLEDITASGSMSYSETCSVFLGSLYAFLQEHPSVSCVITSLPDTYSAADVSRLRNIHESFEVYSLSHFNADKIHAYCTKWFTILARNTDEWKSLEGKNNYEQTAHKIAENICRVSSLRRIMHRPIFLYYHLSVMGSPWGSDAQVYLSKSPVFLMRSIASGAIRSLNSDKFCETMGRRDFDESDIKAPIAMLAFVMMHKNLVHITDKQLFELVDNIRLHLDSSLSEQSCLRRKDGTRMFIELVLCHIPIFKHTGEGSERIYSFASRPLLWYFASYALRSGLICIGKGVTDSFCDGYLSENWHADAAVRYLKRFFVHRCDIARFGDTIDDWATLVSWTAIGLKHGCADVIELLASYTYDPSVANRPVREMALRILPDILSQRPYLDRDMKRKGYDTAFTFFFYKRQRESVHNILASSDRDFFLEHVYDNFIATCRLQFPHFLWVTGYLDWLDLTGVTIDDAIFPPEKSIRQKVLGSHGTSNTGNKIIDRLMDFISAQLNTSEDRRDTAAFIRAVTALCTFFWLRVYETDADTSYTRQMNNSPLPNLDVACRFLLSLLSCRTCCVANVACYALTHILTASEELAADAGWSIRAAITDRIENIILTDYISRYFQDVYKEDKDSPFYTPQPLCGALRLITALPISLDLTVRSVFSFYRYHKNGSDLEREYVSTDMVRNFYREQWEWFASDPETGDTTHEKRYAMLLFKICYILRVWSPDETYGNYRYILTAAEKTTTIRKRSFALRYDRFDKFKETFDGLTHALL